MTREGGTRVNKRFSLCLGRLILTRLSLMALHLSSKMWVVVYHTLFQATLCPFLLGIGNANTKLTAQLFHLYKSVNLHLQLAATALLCAFICHCTKHSPHGCLLLQTCELKLKILLRRNANNSKLHIREDGSAMEAQNTYQAGLSDWAEKSLSLGRTVFPPSCCVSRPPPLNPSPK